ncbi:hypothetical protein BDN67DRAFT_1009485 [Paxillus ammoniavirescens]|nr:hypothetical protein BDN67DRAFT_1009485 [Paxillus ammoniavirescens]
MSPAEVTVLTHGAGPPAKGQGKDRQATVFDAPLSSFRRKDEYITLAGALGISQDGTVEELKTRIKDYIADLTHAADIALS